MKNYIVSLILGLTLVISTSSNLYATCPSGYTSYTIAATYTYTPLGGGTFNCPMTIKYCCKWDNSLKQVVSIIDDFYGTTTNCATAIPDWVDFLTWLHNTVAQSSHLACAPEFPPCDDLVNPYYEVKVTSSRCWKIANRLVDGAYNDYVWVHTFINCQTSDKCVSTWRVCLDYNFSPPKVVRTFVSKVSLGTPACPDTEPTLPPAGKTDEEPWITDCFAKPC